MVHRVINLLVPETMGFWNFNSNNNSVIYWIILAIIMMEILMVPHGPQINQSRNTGRWKLGLILEL